MLSGIDCQMLLYLFTLTSHWEAAPGRELKPAGVQYLLTDPAPASTSRQKALRRETAAPYTVDGLVCDDKAVQQAMDAELKGAYMPTGYNKDGSPKKPAKVATAQKLKNIEDYLDELLLNMAERLCGGKIPARPLQDGSGNNKCGWCPYLAVCGHGEGDPERPRPQMENLFEEREEVIWEN